MGENAAVVGTVRIIKAFGTVLGDSDAAEIGLVSQAPKARKPVENRYMIRRLAIGFELRPLEGARALSCYHVSPDISTCDCADHTYRPNRDGGCKHRRALLALRGRGVL